MASPKTLIQMLSRVAKQNASRSAIVQQDNPVTYAELENDITSLAAQLYEREVRKGDRIALLLPNGPDFVTGYFAIIAGSHRCSSKSPLSANGTAQLPGRVWCLADDNFAGSCHLSQSSVAIV